MAEFKQIYVEKRSRSLYYRKNVELVGPKLGNFFANPTQAESHLERRRLVRPVVTGTDPPGSVREHRLQGARLSRCPDRIWTDREACATIRAPASHAIEELNSL